MKNKTVVIITWHDAVSDHGWQDVKDVKKTIEDGGHIVYSIGVIISRDNRFIYLAADWGEGDENPYNRIFIIPVGMVKKIKTIYRG